MSDPDHLREMWRNSTAALLAANSAVEFIERMATGLSALGAQVESEMIRQGVTPTGEPMKPGTVGFDADGDCVTPEDYVEQDSAAAVAADKHPLTGDCK